MEKLNNETQNLDTERRQRELEVLKTFDSATLETLRDDALSSRQELENLLANIDRIQNERMQEAML
jgi:hypothetical protein|nr:MAG TPA: hypothetical protein [Caudoviricetes sp.]